MRKKTHTAEDVKDSTLLARLRPRGFEHSEASMYDSPGLCLNDLCNHFGPACLTVKTKACLS